MRELLLATAFSVAMAAHFGAYAGESRSLTHDFRLLVLKDRLVRWQVSEQGLPARVTFAYLTSRTVFNGARNCAKMVQPEVALRRSGIATADFRREVRAAFDMWTAAANIEFVETADIRGAGILIGAEAEPRGRAFTNVAESGGTAQVGTIRQSLICLNPDQRWKIGFDGNLDVYDLRYTIAHEIGHAIGLDHPSSDGQLMSYRYRESSRELRAGDIDGAVALYGPSQNASDTDRVAGAGVPAVDVRAFSRRRPTFALGERAGR